VRLYQNQDEILWQATGFVVVDEDVAVVDAVAGWDDGRGLGGFDDYGAGGGGGEAFGVRGDVVDGGD
jgi:hypothetical protein